MNVLLPGNKKERKNNDYFILRIPMFSVQECS